MIYSSIYADDDTSKYPAAIQRAIDYIRNTDLKSMAPGNYPIEGDKMFAKVFDNTSKPVSETYPELHKDYIDLQFFVTGGEMMGYAPKKHEYKIVKEIEEEDVYFLEGVENEQFIRLTPGDYIMLFPNDVHRPGVCEKEPQTYRKAVIKIAVEIL